MSVVRSYSSKVSYGLFIPVGTLLLTAWVTALIYREITSTILLTIVLGGILLPMMLRTNYSIKDDVLNIRCGFFINIDVNITNIRKIAATKSILSAPALSLSNRIEIFYNKYDSVVISPENIPEFTNALKQINPNISLEL